jgi:aspartyl-tRNA synthetase
MTYAEAMRRFASDKPDLRIPLELIDVADVFSKRRILKYLLALQTTLKAVLLPCVYPKATKYHAVKLTNTPSLWAFMAQEAWLISKSTTLAKSITVLIKSLACNPLLSKIFLMKCYKPLERTGAQNGDLIFFGADKAKIVNDAMGALRVKLGHDLKLNDL